MNLTPAAFIEQRANAWWLVFAVGMGVLFSFAMDWQASEAQMQSVSLLQRERVVSSGVALIDIKPALTNADGSFMIGDLDAKGKPRRLRAKDGITFSRVGNDVLANLVMGAMRKGENVPELQSAKVDEVPADMQVAVAVPL